MDSKTLLQKYVQKIIRQDQEGWPPDSAGWFYQPLRPSKSTTPHKPCDEDTSKSNI